MPRFRRVVLAIFCLASPLSAQTLTGAGSTAVPLANLQGSARDLGMGAAFVGVADDASALFFNSAGLAGVRLPEVAVHHNSYLAGTFQEVLSCAFPTGSNSGLGLALNYINWGSLDLRDINGVSQGGYNDTDIGLMAGWGLELSPGFSAGGALRALQQKVVNDLYTSLAGDLGLLWTATPSLRFGLSYANLGTPVAGSSLTGELKGGAALFMDPDPHSRFLLALSGSWFSNNLGAAQAGCEWTLEKRWSLRAGYQLPFTSDQIDGFTHFTAGAGMRFSSFALDYAFLPFGTLGNSHRLSLSYQFDLPKEVVKVPVQVPVTVVQPVLAPPKTQDVEVHFKIPNDPLAEGLELEKSGKLKEAVKAYVAALREAPQNDQIWSALGNLYYKLGQKAYAIECFDRALQLKPDNPALRDWLERYKKYDPSK